MKAQGSADGGLEVEAGWPLAGVISAAVGNCGASRRPWDSVAGRVAATRVSTADPRVPTRCEATIARGERRQPNDTPRIPTAAPRTNERSSDDSHRRGRVQRAPDRDLVRPSQGAVRPVLHRDVGAVLLLRHALAA